MSERPFEQQTPLERTIRAYLWAPTDKLSRATQSLPLHVRRKEYKAAAACQESIRRAEEEIKTWTDLLHLYEQERSITLKVDSGADSEKARTTEGTTQVVGEVVPEAGIEPATKGL